MPAAVVLAAVLAGLAVLALQPQQEVVPPPAHARSDRGASPAADPFVAASVPEAPKALPVAAAPQPAQRAARKPADMLYRFIGKTSTGDRTSFVLFGRGRVVTLDGPGPIDDEHVVEAVFDEYLVLRHVPTATGSFLAMTQRLQVAGPPPDPEEEPHD